ncbi:MAG: ComEC/Rec2 family competence protein [Spirochaetia bacterium]|jgi:ComEC/Rec2-related protein|nr:ComEC/Rec2 family competence protein [Spirochaetia bacterium]
MQRIDRMKPGASLLFTALFTGTKENPNGKLFTSIKKAGASHILALSGMHLGIISLGILFLFTPLFGRHQSFVLTLVLIIIYVFLVKSGPSLIRGAILFSLLGLFSFSGLRIDIFHILVICFLIQVTVYPGCAWELSFQLSYMALGGIILGSNAIRRILPGLIPFNLRTVLAASISAQLFTAPLVLNYFGVTYPVGIISGIILVPLITLFIWTGIFGLIPMPWVIQRLIFMVMEVFYILIESFSGFFSQFPVLNNRTTAIFFIVLLVFIKSTQKS